MVSGTTQVVAVIGHPIAQVKSPDNFNRYFAEQHMDSVMIPVDIAPDAVVDYLNALRGWQNMTGVLVTVPHKQRAAALEDRLFALLAQDGQTLRFEPPMPPESVRRLADAMVRANEACSAVFAGQDGAWHYAMADPSGDLRGLVKRLNAALQGRGGGKPGFVQGSLAASRTDIEAFFTAESCSMPDPA